MLRALSNSTRDEPEESRLILDGLLKEFEQLRGASRAKQDAELVTRVPHDDQRALLAYALALPAERSEPLFEMLRTLEARRAACHPAAPELLTSEFAMLHAAFNVAPAQLHPVLLGSFDAPRAAAVLALGQLPLTTASALWPTLAPLLLCPDVADAQRRAEGLLAQPEHLAPLLAAYRELPLSAQAAVTTELPTTATCLCVLVAGCPTLSAEAVHELWGTLSALAAEECPPEAALTALHRCLLELSPSDQARLARTIGEPGPLVEAAAYLGVEDWVGLVLSMRSVNGRLRTDSSRVSMALMRHEARTVRRAYAANPEDRSMVGFLCGWFLLLVTLLGLVQILSVASVADTSAANGADAEWVRWASAPHMLPLMLDLYLLLSAVLTCALELEINSPLIRDHVARPIERSLAFLQLASGRGVFYSATGLLAFDLRVGPRSSRLTPLMVAGIAMLAFGAFNLLLGSVVALKLKRMRRSLGGPRALVEAYRRRAASEGLVDIGLHHVAASRLFEDLGVSFTKMQLQAVFLEMDAARVGRLDESALLHWYHGHIGRQLKRHANRASPFPRSLRDWASEWSRHRYDVGRYAAVVCMLLLPLTLYAMFYSTFQLQQLPSLVINVYLLVAVVLMLLIELRIEATRRTALHLLRYCSALLHPTARGIVYLVVALTLLSQKKDEGYLAEALGIVYVAVGTLVGNKLQKLRERLPDNAAILAAYRHVAADGRPLNVFSLRLLTQAAGVPLRWRVEQAALLATLDLDRDGFVTEEDLVYWLGSGRADVLTRADGGDEEELRSEEGDAGEEEADGRTSAGRARATEAAMATTPSTAPRRAEAAPAAAEGMEMGTPSAHVARSPADEDWEQV